MEKFSGHVTIHGPGGRLPVVERWMSAAMGSLALIGGLQQRDTLGLGLAAAGGYFLYRSVTGRCFMYQFLGIRHRFNSDVAPVEEKPPASIEDGDKVTESSWESFPTSDAPSWTLGQEQPNE